MDRDDLRRTDNHPAAFCRGWAEAFPAEFWLAGIDERNIQRPSEYRLKAAKGGWSGPTMRKSGQISESFDFHLECKMTADDLPRGRLLLHLETNPYEYLGTCKCGNGRPDCEVCRRRHAARERLRATFTDTMGNWALATDKLTLVKHSLKEIRESRSSGQIASYLAAIAAPLDRWVEEARLAWKRFSPLTDRSSRRFGLVASLAEPAPRQARPQLNADVRRVTGVLDGE